MSLAQLRNARAYPFAPMPAEQRREWRGAAVVDAHDAHDAAHYRERRRQGQRDAESLLRGVARGGGLVTTSNNVAGASRRAFPGLDAGVLRESVAVALGGAERIAQQRETRRERYRLRRAHQALLQVEQKRRADRWHLIEHDGETFAKRVSGGIMHTRLSQLMCGRSAAMRLPESGSGARAEGREDRVGIRRRPEGSASASGLYYCGCVWSCPVCSWHVARERGKELQRVYEHLAGGAGVQGPRLSAYFATLTVRHSPGMPLERTRSAVADAWRKIRQTRGWREWKGRLGYFGDVRALEVTHGKNGWHPHLHLVFFTFAPLPADLGREFAAWLYGEWRKRIGAALGVEPNAERGVQIERVRSRADYLAKLGIGAELSSAHGKEARAEGSRTPWQLLSDVAERLETDPTHRDVRLWREWVEGMHGARQLTWSGELRGVRKALGVVELTDEEAAAAEVERGELVATVPVALWLFLDRRLPGFVARVLEACEAGGGQAVELLVRDLEAYYRGTYDEDGRARVPDRPPPWWSQG